MFLYNCTSQIEILKQIENATYLTICCVFIGCNILSQRNLFSCITSFVIA